LLSQRATTAGQVWLPAGSVQELEQKEQTMFGATEGRSVVKEEKGVRKHSRLNLSSD
jgi:hypothetical protein